MTPDKIEPVGAQFTWLYGEDLPTLDSRTTESITGTSTAMINVWISRGVIPGVSVGAKGRPRSFDASLVFHLAIMSVLVRLGYDAPRASVAAMQAHLNGDARQPGLKLIIEPAPPVSEDYFSRIKEHVVRTESSDALDAVIDKLFPGERPDGFTIVDLSAIWTRVERAIIKTAAPSEPE